ncbi:MAG: hypothetical protein VXZ39_14330, partial [Planctomycetota bacterium]|nr:hypothetical protein [Planctomycetota bacterium]
ELDEGRSGSRPSRSERIRLRKIAREEETLAGRIESIVEAITAEGSLVFAEVLDRSRRDLMRIAGDLGDKGGYDSGPRTQALQSDVDQGLAWLEEALNDELDRRAEEEQQQQEQQDQQEQQQDQQQQQEQSLVPDVAELRLLDRMEKELQARVQQLFELHPELLQEDPEIGPLLRRDLTRLATQNERIAELFTAMRQRLGITEESEGAQEGEADEAPEGEGDDR